MTYQLTDNDSVIHVETGATIPNNPTLAAWQEYQDWLGEGNTPAPASVNSSLNWIAFKTAFLSNADWEAIAAQFSKADIRTGVVSAVGVGDAQNLQENYQLAVADLAAQAVTIDKTILQSWQSIANAYSIPVTFIA